MANVRAGVAYVDVRLGSIEDLKRNMKDQIEGIGRETGKQLGDEVAKSVSPDTGKTIGQGIAKTTSKQFFDTARNDFMSGFRALATGQLGAASEFFKDFGGNLGNSLFSGIQSGVGKFNSFMDGLANKATAFGNSVGNAAQRGWAKFQEFGIQLDRTSQKLGFLSFQIQNFGIISTAAFTAPTVAALGFASAIGIKTAAEIESATSALKFLLGPGYDVEALLKRLQRIAIESPVFDTANLVQFTQTFTSAGVEIGKTERFLKAFSNIALVTGTNTDKANLAVRAISQAFGKGKLQAEELNQQLGEAMPSVLKLLRDQLGVTQVELNAMVKAGEITGDDLIEIFTKIGESEKFLKGAAAGANTLNGTWQNFKETIQTQLGFIFLENAQQIKDAINQLSPALSQLIKDATPAFLGLINGFSKLVGYFSQVVNWYKNLSPGTQDLIQKIILFGSIIGPVVIAVGAFAGAIAGIAAGIAAIATPTGAVIAAVVALGAAITVAVLWLKKFISGNSETAQKIREQWNNFYAEVIGPIVDSFKQLWEGVVSAFNQIKNALTSNTGTWKSWAGFLKELFTGVWAFLKGMFSLIGNVLGGVFGALGSVIKAIASLISGVIKIFKGLTDFLIGVFTGDWKRAWEGVKQIWDGLWDAIVGTLANVGEALWRLVRGIINGIIGFFKNLFNVLVGNSIVPDMVNAIIAWFNRLTAPIRAVFNAIRAALSVLSSAFNTWVNLIRNGIRTVVDWFQDLGGKVRGALSGAASWLYNAGKNIVNGLINGVRSMAGFLKNAILNLIPGPVRSIVSSALGINSPSKVFMGYGKNVVQGFVLGLSAEQEHLNRSLKMFSDQPRFEAINGSPREPLMDSTKAGAGLSIENYYANDNVDPWRQAEDWYFLVSARGGTE